uniref:coiled-coil domain-containing protein 73 isoform X4 n=1 Tax=Monopterus albus TaxID=43700 RepID=UPI0009B4C47B|nr:coiled-coil domain-containing protein 73 isoform X4 [Monopterus albus]
MYKSAETQWDLGLARSNPMDFSSDSGPLSTRTTVGGPALEQELSLSSTQCQTESGGTILLQLLEFKTHLLEAIEELHIRRDAEARFEDQLSKLVLEKQELEWEKESLQQQLETVANQHTESLANVKKQFQAKVRNTEEEKGKYQVSAELKDKEINSLKEELKSLQLLKFNLEKKSNDLEQKLALQSRSKDSHLNQLGEVEKRFNALSRHCVLVKQAHEKLEQNVDEAMRINKKLSSTNEKQEATIVSLKKELEEASKKLIKAKMTSVRLDKTHSPIGKEQHVQQLHQKLNMEVMRSLQHNQQLLLNQTQAVSRVEQELQTQREKYKALKQEHEVMREKSKAVEDKVAQLMDNYAASKTNWDKEKAMFLDRLKSEQQDLQAVFPTLVEETRGGDEPIFSSELPSFGSLQHLASSQSKNPDYLEDTGTLTKLVATGASGGQEALNLHDRSIFKQPLNTLSPFTCPLTTTILVSHSGTSHNNSILTKYMSNSHKGESEDDVISDFICTTYSVSDNLQISKGCGTSTVSSPDCRSIDGSVGLLSKEESEEDNIGMNEKKQGGKDEKHNRKIEEGNTEQLWNREELQIGDVKEKGSLRKNSETLIMAQATDRREDNPRSAEDSGDIRNPETEMRDRADGKGTNGMEKRGKSAPQTPDTPETQILAQATTDTTCKNTNIQQAIDLMDTEPPLPVCEPSDCSQNLYQNDTDKDSGSSHVSKECGTGREGQSLHTLNSEDSYGPKHVTQEEQSLCHNEVKLQVAGPHNQLPNQFQQVSKKTTEERPSSKSTANFTTELSESPNESSICTSQTSAAQTGGTVSIQELATTTAKPEPSNPSDMISDMKQTEEMFHKHTSEECVPVRTMVEPQSLPQSQEISEQENGQLRSQVFDGDGDSCAYKEREGQSNVDTQGNDTPTTDQELTEKSNLKDACVDMMGNVSLESEVKPGNCQDKLGDASDARATKSNSDLKSDQRVHKIHESPETSCSKFYKLPLTKEMKVANTDTSSLPSSKTYRSFDWGSTQRKTENQVVQVPLQSSEQNTSESHGQLRHSLSTIPMFLTSKHNEGGVPLIITRASDMLNAFSVSGTAASSRRRQQGKWKTMAETSTETVAADTESRTSPSFSSYLVSTSSSVVSTVSWQATPGCSRGLPFAAGLISESDSELSSSQERGDQQSSFRAQISKIEEFLNAERLYLPKRQRTEN